MRLSIGFVLSLMIGGLLLSGCRSTAPSAGRSSSATDSTHTERIVARMDLTPDSLASLPRPLFYRSSSSLRAEPLYRGWSPTSIPPVTVRGWKAEGGTRPDADPRSLRPDNARSSATTRVEVIGGVADGHARLGLHLRTRIPDNASLRAFPFVDLFGDQMLLRRGEMWRTLRRERDTLYEKRFVPLSVPDLQRLIRSDTVAVAINQAHFRLPSAIQDELTALYGAVPDSLPVDTAAVENRLTVFHSADSSPGFEGGVKSVAKVLDYPDAAKSRGIEGTVRLGFVAYPDGSVSHFQIEQAAHPLLNAVAAHMAKTLDYNPSSFQGRPVPVWTTMPVVFEMK